MLGISGFFFDGIGIPSSHLVQDATESEFRQPVQ